jgi:hypothetical protein
MNEKQKQSKKFQFNWLIGIKNKLNKKQNAEITEQKIIRNKFGFPIQLEQKNNKIKPK